MHSEPIKSYFQYCRALLLDPTAFFREEFHRVSLSIALTFGIASAWLSTTILFFGHSVTSLALQRIFSNWVEDLFEMAEVLPSTSEQVRSFLYQSGAVVVYPFVALWYISATSGMVYLFSKIFIQDQTNVNYKNCMKILALSLVSSWLLLVPVFGEIIAYISFVILVIIGIREIFWVTTQRAALVVLTPQVLLVAFVTMALGVLAILAMVWANLMVNSPDMI